MNGTAKNAIIRRPDFVGGGITPEEKDRLDKHAKLWIGRAMRTEPAKLEKIGPAIRALYAAAGLQDPRVIVVPSPLVMAVAGGFSSAIWYARKNGGHAATDAATDAATVAATDAATARGPAARLAIEIGGPGLAPLMLECVKAWWRSYQGGNMWPAYACYLSALRDVLGLRLPQHEKFAAWEACAIEGGFRWMHEEFCIVSDFPEVLRVDDQNRPHCEDGPSHRWSDGWSLYHWHGVRIPVELEYIIHSPSRITVAAIDEQGNAELRRVMIERYGSARYLLDSGAQIIHRDGVGLLYRKQVDEDEDIVMVRVLNSTPEPDGVMSRDEAIAIFGDAAKAAATAPADARFKEYMIRVPPETQTAHEAVAWTFGLPAEDYHPAVET